MERTTGVEEHFALKEGKKLRYGYTTGTCAAAAAKAAAAMLLRPERGEIEAVPLMTPKGIGLRLWLEDIRREADQVSCAVRKDGGDDPDVTDGLLIYAAVRRRTEPGILVDGGPGVGRVTRPGLQQPVGEAAINATPRRMILEAVEEACREAGYEGGLEVTISVPRGEEIARRTFNPRLGIQGGISILGTSGIVVPMSEEALIASIRLEMSMLVQNGGRYLVITPGNYGEIFSKEQQLVDLTYSMKCSNYVGATIDMAEELGVRGILFLAHIGKFIKVAGGIMDTHSRSADCRAELLAANALRAGVEPDRVRQILDTVTTEEALGILDEAGEIPRVMDQVLPRVAQSLERRSGGRVETGAILFSNVYGTLGETERVRDLIEKIDAQKKRR